MVLTIENTILVNGISVKNTNIDIEKLEINKLLLRAPSGTGKTSLMNELIEKLVDECSISYVPQDVIEMFLPNLTLGQQSKILIKNMYGVRFFHYLNELNLSGSVLDLLPHQCSGGMLQRFAIACALTNNSRLIILDEPTSHLDNSNAFKVAHLLNKELSKVIVASHDLRFIDSLSNFQSINLAEKGETKQKITFDNKNKKNKVCSFNDLDTVNDIKFSYTFNSSQMNLLTGNSGIGKTQILKTLFKNITSLKNINVDYISQNAYDSFHPMFSILKSLKFEKCDLQNFKKYLSILDLDFTQLDKKPSQLSGGQLQRMQILRALLLNVKILLCDEICSSLDSVAKYQVMQLLKKISIEKEISILYVAHDQEFDKIYFDKHYIIKENTLIRK